QPPGLQAWRSRLPSFHPSTVRAAAGRAARGTLEPACRPARQRAFADFRRPRARDERLAETRYWVQALCRGRRPATAGATTSEAGMAQRAETYKAELIDRAAAQAVTRLGKERGVAVDRFVRQFYANVPPDDLRGESVDGLFGAALSLWSF